MIYGMRDSSTPVITYLCGWRPEDWRVQHKINFDVYENEIQLFSICFVGKQKQQKGFRSNKKQWKLILKWIFNWINQNNFR